MRYFGFVSECDYKISYIYSEEPVYDKETEFIVYTDSANFSTNQESDEWKIWNYTFKSFLSFICIDDEYKCYGALSYLEQKKYKDAPRYYQIKIIRKGEDELKWCKAEDDEEVVL